MSNVGVPVPRKGEVNNGANVGTGANVFKQKSGLNLEMRSIVGTGGITATQGTDEITLDMQGALVFQGDYNAATNTPDLDTSPSGILQGYVYVCSIAGTFFTIALEVGDQLYAKQDNPTLESHWSIVERNLNGSVTAAAAIPDNAIARGDGGAQGIQASNILIDDSGNITGAGTYNTVDIATDVPLNTAKNTYPSADATKVGFIGVTQAVDLDTMESDIATNNAKVTNATHTGEVTGSGALTIDPTAISGKTLVTAVATDQVLLLDATDGALKKADVTDFIGGGGGSPSSTNKTAAFTAAVGDYYTISGATTFTVTLPATHALDDRISIYCVEGYTGILTVDGNGAQTIQGVLTYGMAASDFLELESDGTNWHIINRKGLVYVSGTSNAGQAITSTTKIQYEDNIVDSHSAWSGNDTFTAPRSGKYALIASATETSAVNMRIHIFVNGAAKFAGPAKVSTSGYNAAVVSYLDLDVGDTVSFKPNATVTRSTYADANYLNITEVE